MKLPVDRRGLPRSARVAALIVSAAAFCLTAGLAAVKLPGREVTEDSFRYGYEVSAEGTAESRLTDDAVYPDGVVEMGKLCPYALTKTVEVELSAVYTGTEAAEVSGTYTVEAVIAGVRQSDTADEPVYEKRVTIDSGTAESDEAGAFVNLSLSVDPTVYVAAADAIDAAIGTSPARSVTLVFSGIFTAETSWGEVEAPFSWSLSLPASATVPLYTLAAEAPANTQGSLTEPETHQVFIATPVKAVLIMLPVLCAALCGVLWRFTRPYTDEERCSARKRRALRLYGRYMVCLLGEPPAGPFYPVRDLEQLSALAEEAHSPLFYTADEEGLPRDGLFFVPWSNRVYTVTLAETTPKEVVLSGQKEQ